MPPVRPRYPLTPWRISPAAWDRLFEKLDPIVDSDGKVLARYRLRGTTSILVQQRMDTLFSVEMIERKPLEVPKGGIFYHVPPPYPELP